MNYHKIEIDMSLTDDDLSGFDVSSISKFVLRLPGLGRYGYIHEYILLLYYIIDSE